MTEQKEMLKIVHHSVKLVKEKEGLYTTHLVRNPFEAHKAIIETTGIHEKPNEHFGFLSLSTQNEVIGVHVVFVGSLNASILHPREVFQRAILNNAASIICFHNHPSSNTQPSSEDLQVTKRLKEAGKLIGIEVLDHVIVGDETKYHSMNKNGEI